MGTRLPLFPLGTVLFPGLVLPLHIFEERYRAMVRHLQREEPDAGVFGVVAIERGWETSMLGAAGPASSAGNRPAGDPGSGAPEAGDPEAGDPEAGDPEAGDPEFGAPEGGGSATGSSDAGTAPATPSLKLHEIGCSAEIRQVTEHADGRFDLVTVGRRRFRINAVHAGDAPYLIADVDWIVEAETDARAAEHMMPGLLEVFQRYLEMIRTDGRAGGEQLPDDPTVLSYVIAATAVLTVDDRQRLLAAPTTLERLHLERRLLGREMAILRQVRALPVPLGDLATTPSPN